jgi:uncharacterized protein (TIGR02001 family)
MTAIGCTAAEWSQGLAVLSLLLCGLAHAQGLGGAIGVATDDVYRGVSRSDGQASLQADAHDAFGRGYVGLSGESVRRGRDEHATAELLLYASYEPLLTDDWAGTVQLRRYQYPGEAGRAQFNYDELGLALEWRTRLTASLVLSPDTYAFTAYGGQATSGSGAAYDYSLLWHQPLEAGWAAGAGVGYYDLRGAIDAGYAYWSANLTYQLDGWSLDLRYIDTDQRARQLFGDHAGERVVAAVLWSF